jgi:hypothetical protein
MAAQIKNLCRFVQSVVPDPAFMRGHVLIMPKNNLLKDALRDAASLCDVLQTTVSDYWR